MSDSIPKAENVVVKDKFKERYECILGDDYDEFMKYSMMYIRKAIRVNTNKISVSELKKTIKQLAQSFIFICTITAGP